MRAMCGVLPAEMPGNGPGTEFLWGAPGALCRPRLHWVRHLLLLLPGAGSHRRLPVGPAPKAVVTPAQPGGEHAAAL